jgi:hypothetical protein
MTAMTVQPQEASHCKTASVGPERYCKRKRDVSATHNQSGNQADRGRRSLAESRAIRKRGLDLFLHG